MVEQPYPVRDAIWTTARVEGPWTHIQLDEADGTYSIEEVQDGEVRLLLQHDREDGEATVYGGLDPEQARDLAAALETAADHAERQRRK